MSKHGRTKSESDVYRIPKWIVRWLIFLVVVFVLFAIDSYVHKPSIDDCEDMASEAIRYYKLEVVPNYDQDDIVDRLNVYLEKSRDFYVCMRGVEERGYEQTNLLQEET